MAYRTLVLIEDASRDRSDGGHLKPDVAQLLTLAKLKRRGASKNSALSIFHGHKESSNARRNELVGSRRNVSYRKFPIASGLPDIRNRRGRGCSTRGSGCGSCVCKFQIHAG